MKAQSPSVRQSSTSGISSDENHFDETYDELPLRAAGSDYDIPQCRTVPTINEDDYDLPRPSCNDLKGASCSSRVWATDDEDEYDLPRPSHDHLDVSDCRTAIKYEITRV